jgi:indole-3-glycerol phosphate synthase
VNVEGSQGLLQLVSAEGFVAVAESGVKGRPDVRAAARSGADAVLVGEHVMRAADPAGAVEELTGVRGLGRGDRWR